MQKKETTERKVRTIETVVIEIPIEVKDNTDSGLDKIIKKFGVLEKASISVQKSVKQGSEYVSRYDKGAEKTQKRLEAWTKQKYQMVLEAMDKVSPILEKLSSTRKRFLGKAWSVTLKAKDLATAPINKILKLLKNPILQVGAVLGVGIGFKDTVDTYKTFEATMSKVQALSNASALEMGQLNQKAKEMGAVTKYSGTESAEAFTYLAQSGWGVQDMVDGISGVMSLAASDGLDLAATADIVANALTAFGLKARDSGQFADVLATASAASNTNLHELGEAFKYVAPVAGAMKYSIQDVSLALGIMSNNGVKGSMAGTALRTAIANMTSPTDAMATSMKLYGISLTDSQGKMKSLRGVLDNVRGSLGNLTEKEQAAAAANIFGKEAMSGMLAIVNASEKDYKALAEQIDHANGAADRMAATMQDNLAGAFEQLGGSMETLKLSWGERIKPYLMSLAHALTDAMPAIEEFGLKAFDALDEKVKILKNKLKEVKESTEFQNADFFGKVQIAWDEIIGKPFADWWDSKGRDMMTIKARDLGEGIGTVLSGGLLALLGVDGAGIISEGESIGASFARGFMSGFDVKEIQGRIGDSIKGVFSNASKILPGGKDADLSSWLSAAVVAKIGFPLIGGGFKAIGLGKTLIGGIKKSLSDGLLGKMIGGIKKSRSEGLLGNIIGSASMTGAGNLSGSGLKGLMAKTGMRMGATAKTGTGMALAGTATVAGALTTASTLISAIGNYTRAVKSTNARESQVYANAGADKLTGAAAGAVIGTIIMPGIGTLIGSGIGSAIGSVSGNKKIEKYEEELRQQEEAKARAELMQEKIKMAGGNAKFETQELNDLLRDSTKSAYEFGVAFQKAVGDNLKSHFGDIKLSMTEIQEIAKKLVFGADLKKMEAFSEAADTAKRSYASLEDSMSALDKMEWKAGLGIKLEETEVTAYKSTVDNMLEEAKTFVEDKHYEVVCAVNVLLKPKEAKSLLKGIDEMYSETQKELDKATKEYKTQHDIVMKDGKITADEQKILDKCRKKITDITDKLSQSEHRAEINLIIAQSGGGELDADSAQALQRQMEELAAEKQKKLNESYKLTSDELEEKRIKYNKKEYTDEEYASEKKTINVAYQKKREKDLREVENFGLDNIVSTYAKELDGILPDLKGTTSEKISQTMRDYFIGGGTTDSLNSEMITKLLGLNNLEGMTADTQAAIASYIENIYKGIPELAELYAEKYSLELPIMTKGAVRLKAETESRIADPESGIGEEISGKLEELSKNPILSRSWIEDGEGETGASGLGGGYAEKISESILTEIEAIDTEVGKVELQEKVQEITNIDTTALDYSSFSSSLGTGLSAAITAADREPISAAIVSLYTSIGEAINAAFAIGYQTTTSVTVTVDYRLANPTASLSFSGGGTGSTTIQGKIVSGGTGMSKFANGGFVSGRQLSWVGEEGAEAIIPLVPGRRSRALELYEKAGEILGVGKHATGDMIGNAIPYRGVEESHYSESDWSDENWIPESSYNNDGGGTLVPVSSDSGSSDSPVSVDVHVSLAPQFEISGQQGTNADSVLKIIREHLEDLSDEIGGEIANKIVQSYQNMPKKGNI